MKCPNCKKELEIMESAYGFCITAICHECKESWYGLKDVVIRYLENKTLNIDVFKRNVLQEKDESFDSV